MVLVVIGGLAIACGLLFLITDAAVAAVVLFVFGVILLVVGIRIVLRNRET